MRRRDGGQSGGEMTDRLLYCRDRRRHSCVVSPTRIAVPDNLVATASVAAATVWTAAAAAAKHENTTKNYRRAHIDLISERVRCQTTFFKIFQFLSIFEYVVHQYVLHRATVLYEHCDWP